MALFKILKGNSSNLSSQEIREGYCYVTTDEHKMYIDTSTERFALNAKQADQLNPNLDTGSSTIPVYFDNGKPKSCVNDFVFFDELENTEDNIDINSSFVSKAGDEMTGNLSAPLFIGPLQGNAATATKLATPRTISLTGDVTGSGTFDGSGDLSITTTRTSPALPTGGTAGQVLVKNSSTDGDASWTTNINGNAATATTASSCTGNSATATTASSCTGNAATATKLATARTISLTGSVTGNGTFDGSGNLNIATTTNHTHSYLPLSGGPITGQITNSYSTGSWWIGGRDVATIRNTTSTSESSFAPIVSSKTQLGSWDLGPYHPSEDFYFSYATDANYDTNTNETTATVCIKNTGVLYGAVWNDYAEYRICKEDFKPGQVIYENGDDTLSISTKRLQRGCSIISDTFGFAIGETDEAKCPIAVSGRVLAYGYEDREEFKKHIGWPVGSGPNGTVSIMTEEEEEKYPSRIIGTISSVPYYETWGTGNVQVDNRIWIKVR